MQLRRIGITGVGIENVSAFERQSICSRKYFAVKRVPRYPYKTLDGKEHLLECINMEKVL